MTTADGVSRPKILIVDDIELVCILTAVVLGDQFDVETATDGNAALCALDRATFDLVLMDLDMPGLSGYEAVANYRHNAPARDTLIVALSASTDAESVRRATASGMNGHIARPIGPIDLKRRINLLLAERVSSTAPPEVWRRDQYDEIVRRIGAARSSAVLAGLLSSLADTGTMLLTKPLDTADLRRRSHDLASVAGMLGFEELFRLCRSLQDDGDTDALNVPRLSTALDRASLVIEAELSEKH